MKYYVFNSQSNSLIVCNNLEDLIRWFARGNYNNFWSTKKHNHYFDDIAMNWNDNKSDSSWDSRLERTVNHNISRNLMVFDEYDRVIDPRQFKEQIFSYIFTYSSYRKNKEKFVFRRGPVPGIHKSKWHRGTYYRRPRTTQELRKSQDVEVQMLIRPARNCSNLVNAWDEIPRKRDHSWKASKLKKQWMKHLK